MADDSMWTYNSKEGFMDPEHIFRLGEEMMKAQKQANEARAQKMVDELGITRELALYLLGLEGKIEELEKRGRPTES